MKKKTQDEFSLNFDVLFSEGELSTHEKLLYVLLRLNPEDDIHRLPVLVRQMGCTRDELNHAFLQLIVKGYISINYVEESKLTAMTFTK